MAADDNRTIEGTYKVLPEDFDNQVLNISYLEGCNSDEERAAEVASWVLQLFSSLDTNVWGAITEEQLWACHEMLDDEFGDSQFLFDFQHGLVHKGLIVKGTDGKYRVTVGFIKFCLKIRCDE